MKILKLIVFAYYLCCFAESEDIFSDGSYIFGIRPVDCESAVYKDGIPVFYTGKTARLYVFGSNFSPTTEMGFTENKDDCDYPIPSTLMSDSEVNFKAVAIFTPISSHSYGSTTKYYICLKDTGSGESVWRHQGDGKHVTVYVAVPIFSLWMYVCFIILCYSMSSLMTGLNLGLMSLDNSELQLLEKAGTHKEKKYARKIIPVRKNGNYLVCSIVITSTLCNTVSTVSTDMFLSNVGTVVITTVIIVLFCEILPQSICSAFPLYIAARTIAFTRACMFLTFPVSYPLSKLLDCLVGKELAKSYNKARLKELLKKTNLPTHEEKIISGTLDFSGKTVEQIMTNIDDVFKLPITAEMNFQTIAAILASGYSRIPIYVGDKSNIRYVLLTKDLALLDPDEKVPVNVLVQKSKSNCRYIPKGTTLDKVLGQFKDSRQHILFVTDQENISDKKKDLGVIGLVTFEDMVEEIFQIEILDETDTIFDNREKRRLSNTQKAEIISLFLKPTKANTLSENVRLSTFCFLSEIEEFSVKNVSPRVLINLLNLDVFYTTSGNKLPLDTIYVRGVPADYFVMILEGQMDVKVGNEELIFEAGAFRYFGVEALRTKAPFTPDYTLQGATKTLYLKVPVAVYDAALLATRFERFREVPSISTKSDVSKYYNLLVGSDAMSHSSSKIIR